MASHPVTPQSKQNGSDLHDPFTDEKPEDRFSPDEFGEETASEVHRADEKAPREETPSLFYAYARRVGAPCSTIPPLTLKDSSLANIIALRPVADSLLPGAVR